MTAGCDAVSLEVLTPNDGGVPEASPVDAAQEAESAACKPVDLSCDTSDECCSGLCALDAFSRRTCRPTTGCAGVGSACTIASACCSLSCFAPDGTSGTCASSPLCGVAGSPCVYGVDCCSNACNNGTCMKPPGCAPAGEACKGNAECCGQRCTTASDGKLRCELLEACRVVGELCGMSADCCSGSCAAGRCAPLPPCAANDGKPGNKTVGEPCNGPPDCATRYCDAKKRCAPIGGCAPQCERCDTNADCCAGSCVADSSGVKRCASSGCGPDGEICSGDAQCCSSFNCTPDSASQVLRCERASACGDAGASCAVPSECCGGPCVPSPQALAFDPLTMEVP
jgi:hypothetical protein